MSKRKTKFISINISAGVFPTYEEAQKEADAIKQWIIRLCEKNGYSCRAIIGISKNNPNTGSITTDKTGKRGRPPKKFKRTTKVMSPTEVDAHLHIVIFANPADMITSELRKHLNKKYKKKVVWSNDCTDYVNNAVNYLIKQSLKLRTLDYDRNDLLSPYEWEIREEEESKISFTKNEVEAKAESIENTIVRNTFSFYKKLQCNNILNITTDINICIDKVYNLYTHLKKEIEDSITNISRLYISNITTNDNYS